MSIKKIIKRMKHRDKVNPGRKKVYQPLPRPRSVVFDTDKKYKRIKRWEITDDN